MSTVPGLTEVSLGQQPALVRELMDTDMDEIPELPPDHPRYEQRRESRTRAQKENDINALKRYRVIMDLRTGLFASLYVSVKQTNSIFAQHLLELCDYNRHCCPGGYFDGSLAYSMMHTKLFGASRRKTDISFYDSAKDLQKKNRLPDSCTAKQFMTKAHAWVYKIRPNLQQKYSDEDAAEYIMDLMPYKHGTDARRVRGELKADGTFLNLPHLCDMLEGVILEAQPLAAVNPTFVSVSADISRQYDLLQLADTCGMCLTAPKGLGSPAFASTGDGKQWCDNCPHHYRSGEDKPYLCDPNAALTWPPAVHENADLKKKLLGKKVANAKAAGVTCAKMTNPSPEAIKAWKDRFGGRGGRGRDGRGRGPRGRGNKDKALAADADGAAAPAAAEGAPKVVPGEVVAGGAAVESFFSGLVDVTDVNLCAFDCHDLHPPSAAPHLHADPASQEMQSGAHEIHLGQANVQSGSASVYTSLRVQNGRCVLDIAVLGPHWPDSTPPSSISSPSSQSVDSSHSSQPAQSPQSDSTSHTHRTSSAPRSLPSAHYSANAYFDCLSDIGADLCLCAIGSDGAEPAADTDGHHSDGADDLDGADDYDADFYWFVRRDQHRP